MTNDKLDGEATSDVATQNARLHLKTHPDGGDPINVVHTNGTTNDCMSTDQAYTSSLLINGKRDPDGLGTFNNASACISEHLPAHTPSSNLEVIGPNRAPTGPDGSNDWRFTVGTSNDKQPGTSSTVEINTAVDNQRPLSNTIHADAVQSQCDDTSSANTALRRHEQTEGRAASTVTTNQLGRTHHTAALHHTDVRRTVAQGTLDQNCTRAFKDCDICSYIFNVDAADKNGLEIGRKVRLHDEPPRKLNKRRVRFAPRNEDEQTNGQESLNGKTPTRIRDRFNKPKKHKIAGKNLSQNTKTQGLEDASIQKNRPSHNNADKKKDERRRERARQYITV